MEYFGVNLRNKTDGMELSRTNYIPKSNKNSFYDEKINLGGMFNIGPQYYDDEEYDKMKADALINFDLNMAYFNSLDVDEFNNVINSVIVKSDKWVEVTDLNPYRQPGNYIMIIGKYKQLYVGETGNIRKRIMQHWSNIKPIDRLIFGTINTSKLSIDSFRALDTTRIFVFINKRHLDREDSIIKQIPEKFLCNRISGGECVNLYEALAYHERMERNFNIE